MSHRKPSKTDFKDEWKIDALCPVAVQSEPSLITAWDNILVDFDEARYEPDPQASVAKAICSGCPSRRECLVDAIADNEAEGLRAGYRFNQGTVDKYDARAIFSEYSLRARVKKTNFYSDVENTDTEEV